MFFQQFYDVADHHGFVFKPTTVKIGNVQQFLVTLYQMKTRLFLISPPLFKGRANKVRTSAHSIIWLYPLRGVLL
jgi:hypothetical protein